MPFNTSNGTEYNVAAGWKGQIGMVVDRYMYGCQSITGAYGKPAVEPTGRPSQNITVYSYIAKFVGRVLSVYVNEYQCVIVKARETITYSIDA